MVVGIVALTEGRDMTAADNAPRAAALYARCRHRIFMVITARRGRQQLFPVAENRAVALVGKRPARADVRERGARFRRQVRPCR